MRQWGMSNYDQCGLREVMYPDAGWIDERVGSCGTQNCGKSYTLDPRFNTPFQSFGNTCDDHYHNNNGEVTLPITHNPLHEGALIVRGVGQEQHGRAAWHPLQLPRGANTCNQLVVIRENTNPSVLTPNANAATFTTVGSQAIRRALRPVAR